MEILSSPKERSTCPGVQQTIGSGANAERKGCCFVGQKRRVIKYATKVTMKKVALKKEFIAGILSSYPICCILWYLMRSKILYHLVLPRGIEFYKKVAIYEKEHFRNKTRHIQCPLHTTIQKNPKYHRCKECNWVQLESDKCNVCELHPKMRHTADTAEKP